MALDQDKLLAFMRRELGHGATDIEPSSLLFSTGIIDSFALVDLMSFVEEEGGFSISPADVNLANFDSIERILAYAERCEA